MAATANVAFIFITITSLMSCYSAARESPIFNQLQINATAPPPASSGGNIFGCLASLNKIKSCSGAIIDYIATGAVGIPPPCCDAIAVIAHECWPAVLTEVGFSRDEIDVQIRGYCNAFSAAAAYATTSGSDPSTTGPVDSPLGEPLSPEN